MKCELSIVAATVLAVAGVFRRLTGTPVTPAMVFVRRARRSRLRRLALRFKPPLPDGWSQANSTPSVTASMCEQHRPRVGMQVRWDDPGREARFKIGSPSAASGECGPGWSAPGWSLASRSSQPESGGPSQRPSWCSSARCRRTSRSRSATCAATADRRDAADKSDAAVPRDCERSPAMRAPPSRPLRHRDSAPTRTVVPSSRERALSPSRR